MPPSSKSSSAPPPSERAIFTLPAPLVAEIRAYAKAVRGGNKSGFVADAVRAYIELLRKKQYTAMVRESYAAAASDELAVLRDWEAVDAEAWDELDKAENAGSGDAGPAAVPRSKSRSKRKGGA